MWLFLKFADFWSGDTASRHRNQNKNKLERKRTRSKKPCSSHKIQIGKFFDVISLRFHMNFFLILPSIFLDSYENVISKMKCLIKIEFQTQKGQRIR